MLAILQLLGTFVANWFKSRRRLEVENLFLRHQLNIALRRPPHRLQLRGRDRALLVWMTWLWPSLLGLSRVIQPAHIGVAVDKGVVTLTGHVASYAEKQAAIAAVRRVKGVRAIAEEIEVRYPSDKKTPDDEIAKRAIAILGWGTMVQVMVAG
jgi:BON domain